MTVAARRARHALSSEAARLADPWCLAAAYFLLIGGLIAGIVVPGMRLVGIVLGALVVVDLVRHLRERHDAVDLAAGAALVLLALGALGSTNPRSSAEVLLFDVALLALFIRLRRLFARPASRDRLLTLAARLAAGVAAGVALLWSWESIGWWAEGAPGLPPAGLDYSDEWFRNLNLLPVYLVLLWPAAAHCSAERRERVVPLIALAGMLLVTVLSASRAAWLGVMAGGATFGLLVLADRGATLRRLRRRLPAAALLLAVLALAGVWSGLAEGVTDLATLRVRTEIWDAALARWREHHLTGTGVGTITAELLRGGLAADGRAPAPHAHSIGVQLLAEAGLLGAAAALLGSATAAWSAARAPAAAWVPHPRVRTAAAAALAAYLVDGLADNHSAIAAVDVLAIGNLALLTATPSAPAEDTVGRRGSRGFAVGRVLLAVLLVAALAQALAWGAGALAWERAQHALVNGRRADAASELRLAHTLDPHLAVYARELGKLRAALDDAEGATELIAAAARRNRGDPNAHRALGVLALRDGRLDAAIEALRTAAELDATRFDSFLLLGVAFDRARLRDEADDAYATAIALAPGVLLSDGWAAVGVAPERLVELVEPALDLSAGGQASIHLATRRAGLLTIIADRTRLDRLLESGLVPAADSWRAVVAAEAGELEEAVRLLEASRDDGRRAVEYWLNRAFVHELAGDGAESARCYRVARMLAESVAPPPETPPTLLAAIAHDPNDFWMYGRSTSLLSWDAGLSLPSPARGAWLRLRDPGSIEVPALRELRFDRPPSGTGAASERP